MVAGIADQSLDHTGGCRAVPRDVACTTAIQHSARVRIQCEQILKLDDRSIGYRSKCACSVAYPLYRQVPMQAYICRYERTASYTDKRAGEKNIWIHSCDPHLTDILMNFSGDNSIRSSVPAVNIIMSSLQSSHASLTGWCFHDRNSSSSSPLSSPSITPPFYAEVSACYAVTSNSVV